MRRIVSGEVVTEMNNVGNMVQNLDQVALGATIKRVMMRIRSLGGLQNLPKDQFLNIMTDFRRELQQLIYQDFSIQVTDTQIQPFAEALFHHWKKDLDVDG